MPIPASRTFLQQFNKLSTNFPHRPNLNYLNRKKNLQMVNYLFLVLATVLLSVFCQSRHFNMTDGSKYYNTHEPQLNEP